MHRKCYTHIVGAFEGVKLKGVSQKPKPNEWSIFNNFGNTFILYRTYLDRTEFAMAFAISFPVLDIKPLLSVDDTTTYGLIRKARLEKQIQVKDIARQLGISRYSYMHLEQGKYELHHMDKLKQLCEILDLEPNEIYTPYQLFIMNNQGKQIKKFRVDNNLTQRQLAELLGVNRKQVGRWENNYNQIEYEKWVLFEKIKASS